MWENLISILGEMVELYRGMLRLTEQKRQVLIAAKSQELTVVTQHEEVLILQIGRLESLRETAIRQIASTHGLAPDKITLNKVHELADEKIAARLAELGEQLTTIVGELTPLNQQNAQLIQQALNYVNYNINILAQNAAGPTYSSPKNAQTPAGNNQRRTLFDAKA